MEGAWRSGVRATRSRFRVDDDPLPPRCRRHGVGRALASATTSGCAAWLRESSSNSDRRSPSCSRFSAAATCRCARLPPTVGARARAAEASGGSGTNEPVFRLGCLDRLSALAAPLAVAGQAPGTASAPDIPISHHDRFYTVRINIQHRFGDRPVRQQAARSPASRRSGARRPEPALSRPAARAWNGLFARPSAPSRSSPSDPIPSRSSTPRRTPSSTSRTWGARLTRRSSHRRRRNSGVRARRELRRGPRRQELWRKKCASRSRQVGD